jgi:diguanylate cyclase
MFFSGQNSRPAPVSDAVHAEIIASLYGTAVPVLFAGIGLAIVGSITARETGDTLTAVLTVLGVGLSFIRTLDVFSYRRRTVATPLARVDAVVWEWRYAAGSVAMAFIIGLFARTAIR